MMKKRKIAMISAFATAILCGALGFASCKKNEEPPAPEEPKDKVTISAEEIRLDLHESAELFAVSALGKTIEWENSAPSVAVYENGKVSAGGRKRRAYGKNRRGFRFVQRDGV